jgi:hypothetical protein
MIEVRQFSLSRMDDSNRSTFSAEIVANAHPPSSELVELTATGNIWTGDNPTLNVIRGRIVDAIGRATLLSEAQRNELAVAKDSEKRPTTSIKPLNL